jgi:hypothetical protein
VKKTYTFKAAIVLNPEKAGGWLASWSLSNDQDDNYVQDVSAWKNASAAKRHIKTAVQTSTPRKSVKMEPIKLNEAGKPVTFAGLLTFKGDK